MSSSSSRPALVATQEASSSSSATQQKRVVPPKGWLHFVAGGAAGMCGAIVTSPLDVVKTRLQSDLFNASSSSGAGPSKPAPAAATPVRSGVLASARRLGYHFVETGILLKEISVKEGPKALFKGLGPTLVGAVPARAINFYTYGNGKLLLSEHFNAGQETALIHLASAAIAGIVTATATNPIWVVKTRLQLESHAFQAEEKRRRAQDIGRASGGQPRGRVAAAAAVASTSASPSDRRGLRSSALASASAAPTTSSNGASPLSRPNFFRPEPRPARPSTNSLRMTLMIVQQEGIKGLYRGLSASYLGVAEGTIQWVLYERLKKWGGAGQNDALGAESTTRAQKWLNMVGAAGTAKCIASLITYPHEVIRTRLRQQPPAGQAPRYTGLVQTFKLVLKEEGAAALYGGLSAHLLRVVPNAAIMFSVYELALRLGSRVEILPTSSSSEKTASVAATAETSTEG